MDMEFKRRRMIKSEIDRLLSDEGTRNLLQGFRKTSGPSGTVVGGPAAGPIGLPTSRSRSASASAASVVTRNLRISGQKPPPPSSKHPPPSRKIIKKSLRLLGQQQQQQAANNKAAQKTAKLKQVSQQQTNSKKVQNGLNSGASSGSKKIKMNNGIRVKNDASTNGVIAKFQNAAANLGYGANFQPQSLPLLATKTRDHVAFVTLSYSGHQCRLRTQDLRDLVRKFEDYESRKGISVIVLNSSSDRIFCDGLDYKELIHSDLNKRKNAVQARINSIKNFLTTLSKSKKILVASVNGGRVDGFGFMFLSLFDVVFANDKATFCLQSYSHLNQPPEGISTFNQITLSSPMMKSILYARRVCTASEMYEKNLLVSEVLWDDISRYQEQLASKLQHINSQEQTKSIFKTFSEKTMQKLSQDLTDEFSSLESIWMSNSWQNHYIHIQKTLSNTN